MQRLPVFQAAIPRPDVPLSKEFRKPTLGGAGWCTNWLLMLLCLTFLLPALSHGADVKLSWNRNPESDVTGYIVRYGTDSGRYSKAQRVGTTPRTRISGLKEGKTYYFGVVAVNRAGLKSKISRQVKHKVRVNRAPNSWIDQPSTNGTVMAGDVVRFVGGGSDPDGDTPLSFQWDFGAGSGITKVNGRSSGPVRFNQPGTYQVKLMVADARGKMDPTPATRTIQVVARPPELVPRSGWSLKYVDSEDSNGFAATASFDGDPKTFWHTEWRNPDKPKPPHEIQINLGTVAHVTGFRYLPRQDRYTVGNIGNYRFYVSRDGRNWGAPVASGTFDASSNEKQVMSTPKTGRFIRLVSFGDANGYTDSNMAELRVLQGVKPNAAASAKAASVSTSRNRKVSVKLRATDREGNPLTFKVTGKPKRGKLTGRAPNFTYKPRRGFTGTDRITYRVFDGKTWSKKVTVRIRVRKPSASPAGAAAAPAFAATASQAPPRTTRSVTYIDGRKYRTLAVSKPAQPDGLVYHVEVSPDLLRWYRGTRHTTVLADNERILKVRDNTPVTAQRKRYIRLRTTAK